MNGTSSASKSVSIIGIGRLGVCFALVLAKKGFNVLGVDVNPSYVDSINNKTLRSNEPQVETLLKEAKTLRATTNLDEAVAHSDLLVILVATPSSGTEHHYDHSVLGNVLLALNQRKVKDKHIVIGCTVIPGYIAKVGRFLIRDTENCTLSYNPEFIAQGDIINGQLKPDMVLIGEGNQEAGDRIQSLYEHLCDNKPIFQRMSPESAEICKLGVNCFVTMKLSFSNLIGDIANKTPNANKLDICRAIGSDTRVGAKYMTPGYGFGGPCFPRDNRALGGYAKQVGVNPLLFNATDEYNSLHTEYQFQDRLKEDKESYVFTGVAYKDKTKVPIIEESQKLKIAVGLAKAGRKVLIRDYADIIREVQKEWGHIFSYEVLAEDYKY